ncbi:MAG: hypothetical protein WC734_00270 [Patescibacteria group bacterium]|jgi:hypothetical protein
MKKMIWVLMVMVGLVCAGTTVQAGDQATATAVCLSVDSKDELATVTPVTSPMYWYDSSNGTIYMSIYVDIPAAVNPMGKSTDGIGFVYLAGFDKSGKKQDDIRGDWKPGQMFVVFALTPKVFARWNPDDLQYLRATNGNGQDVWPWTWEESRCVVKQNGRMGYHPTYDAKTHMFWGYSKQ